MSIANRSLERPGEWLLELARTPTLYRELVDERGLAVAAYFIARARCTVRTSSTVPTSSELRAAARELIARADLACVVPKSHTLAEECEREGLLVIAPLGRAA